MVPNSTLGSRGGGANAIEKSGMLFQISSAGLPSIVCRVVDDVGDAHHLLLLMREEEEEDEHVVARSRSSSSSDTWETTCGCGANRTTRPMPSSLDEVLRRR